jgi:hypothetical protein
MAGLSVGMAVSVAMLGMSSPAWSATVVAVVGAVLSATALSWHGILLSEAARLAPAGTIAAVTGGVLSFGQVGAFAGPLVFSLLLGLTGGYGAGWALCALPGLWIGVMLLRPTAAIRGEPCGSGELKPGRFATERGYLPRLRERRLRERD